MLIPTVPGCELNCANFVRLATKSRFTFIPGGPMRGTKVAAGTWIGANETSVRWSRHGLRRLSRELSATCVMVWTTQVSPRFLFAAACG